MSPAGTARAKSLYVLVDFISGEDFLDSFHNNFPYNFHYKFFEAKKENLRERIPSTNIYRVSLIPSQKA
jgi:hypothetical protein